MLKKVLSIKCSDQLVALIEKKTKLTGIKKSDVVRNMLLNSFNLDFPTLPITERSSLPTDPGIYWVYTPDNQLLYLGKAQNLNKAWVSHFRYEHFIAKSAKARVGWFKVNLDELPEIEPNLATQFQLNSQITLKNLPTNRAVTLELSENDWIDLKKSTSTAELSPEVLLQKVVSKIISTGNIQKFLDPNYFSETTENDTLNEIKQKLADLEEKITKYDPEIERLQKCWPALNDFYKDFHDNYLFDFDDAPDNEQN